MLEWLLSNASVVSAMANVAFLLIWIAYLQLFYRSYHLANRPHILIHQAGGFDLDGSCFITNMSEKPAHVAAILVDMQGTRDVGACTWHPVDPEPIRPDQEDPLRNADQGPIATGSYFMLGSFRQLLEEGARRLGAEGSVDALDETIELRVRVVAFVGPQPKPVGAYRRFRVRLERGAAEVRPLDLFPQRLHGWRRHRTARRWLEEAIELDPAALQSPPRRT